MSCSISNFQTQLSVLGNGLLSTLSQHITSRKSVFRGQSLVSIFKFQIFTNKESNLAEVFVCWQRNVSHKYQTII